jgi:hypothetical protein
MEHNSIQYEIKLKKLPKKKEKTDTVRGSESGREIGFQTMFPSQMTPNIYKTFYPSLFLPTIDNPQKFHF